MTVIVGEIANFVAYAFAPAILVAPLGALSIIVRYNVGLNHLMEILMCEVYWSSHSYFWLSFSCSAVLAHIMLKEKLHILGILGCILCVVGSTSIVLYAPPERQIESVKEVWFLATEPGSSLSTNSFHDTF